MLHHMLEPNSRGAQQKFKCHCCSQERTAQPRCRFTMELSDKTASTSITVFGENAEKLFNITATKLMESSDENGLADVNAFIPMSTCMERYFQLKPSMRQEDRFIVINVKDTIENHTLEAP